MDKTEEYRANAARALRDLDVASNPEDKKLLQKLAGAWLDLADGKSVMLGAEFFETPRNAARPHSKRN